MVGEKAAVPLTAGRELDALIAEKIFGMKVEWLTEHGEDLETGEERESTQPICQTFEDKRTGENYVPWYSSDIMDAWDIAEHFVALGHSFSIEYGLGIGLPAEPGWCVLIDGRLLVSYKPDPAMAICLAGLEAVRREIL